MSEQRKETALTDIKKIIEEEAVKYAMYNPNDPKYKDDFYGKSRCIGAYHGYQQGYKDALKTNRWREVSEELPEDNDRVLVKSKRGGIYLSCYSKLDGFSSNANITEWKPIE